MPSIWSLRPFHAEPFTTRFRTVRFLISFTMKKQITVLKVGGKIVEDPQSLSDLLNRFARIAGHKVLVHGGGRTATDLATRMGIETKMVNGRRITDAEMLRIVTMVYGGLVNKNVVAQLQARGINALGLTGADLGIIRSHKRPVIDIDYGFAGDIEQVNGERLAHLINSDIVPVMAPLTCDAMGQILNTNADTIAAETAKALAPFFEVTLVYTFEKKGVLSNPDNEDSVIPHINAESFKKLVADGTIQGGMIPKIHNALEAIASGVQKVIITNTTAIDGQQGTTIEA